MEKIERGRASPAVPKGISLISGRSYSYAKRRQVDTPGSLLGSCCSCMRRSPKLPQTGKCWPALSSVQSFHLFCSLKGDNSLLRSRESSRYTTLRVTSWLHQEIRAPGQKNKVLTQVCQLWREGDCGLLYLRSPVHKKFISFWWEVASTTHFEGESHSFPADNAGYWAQSCSEAYWTWLLLAQIVVKTISSDGSRLLSFNR